MAVVHSSPPEPGLKDGEDFPQPSDGDDLPPVPGGPVELGDGGPDGQWLERPDDLDWVTGRLLDGVVFFGLLMTVSTTFAAIGVLATHTAAGWITGAALGVVVSSVGTWLFHLTKVPLPLRRTR